MTKREMFEAIKNVEGVRENAEMVEFLDKQIALVSKKRTGLTAVQKANAETVEKIFDFIADKETAVTINDIMEAFEVSNQKASALVKKLVDAGRVAKSKDGKKVTYQVA